MAQRQYVSGAVSALNGDGIVVHVINDSDAVENTHVTIYLNTGGGATVAEDTGNTAVAATWTWGLGFTVSKAGEYWVRIQTSSEFLIPKMSFERLEGSNRMPLVTYTPGDFAVFEPQPRKRIW